MELIDFKKDFIEDVKATAAAEGEGSSAAFIESFSNYLLNSEVLSDFVPSFYLGTGKNNRKIRVDGYVLDEFDFTLNLIIADYTGEENRDTLTKSNAEQLFERLRYFIEEVFLEKLVKEVEISTPVADLIELMRYHKDRIRKYRLILLTDGIMSGRINTIPAKNLNNIPVECQIWDIDRLFKVCASDTGRQNIEIDFKAYTEKGIPFLQASNTDNEDYKSFLCIIPGQALADIYDFFGSQLLEGNVRSFLSTKVAVNKKIRETILNRPEKFFAYNNGISATAIDLKIEDTPNGKYITYAKDFQIINGGQTTASLSNARYRDKAELEAIFVQMKLTEIDANPEKATELIRNISRSSNSQNKVSDADFFATHPFHIRMEQISRRIFAPAVGGAQYETKWFYERARGQYLQEQMRMSKSEKAKFVTQHPKKQVITKTDFAKVRNTWLEIPHIVSKGAQTNFMRFAEIIDGKWSDSDRKYNDKYFKDTVALVILFKHTESLVSHQLWYEQGYRANIVTYSIALLKRLIKSQFPNKNLDLQLIWNKQEIPDMITSELIKITKLVFDVITDPNRETINVTQWCKRESCWSKVKDCNLILKKEIEKVLVGKEVEKEAEKEAKSDRQILSDLEAQMKVLEYGAEFWKKIYEFQQLKKIGTPESIGLLRTAMQIPNKIPTPFNSLKLLEIVERVESEGYKITEV